MSVLKNCIERFCPGLAQDCRLVRDARRRRRDTPRRTPFGFVMAGSELMASGQFETDEVELVKQNLERASVLVDVGANVGFYTLLARSLGKRVIAIEPLPQNVDYLCANLLANNWADVEVLPVGLSAKPGVAVLHGGSTGASLVAGWANASPLLRRPVPLSTLDLVLSGRFAGEQLFIKVDVEGAEHTVLQGAEQTLARNPRPVWMVEVCLTEHRPDGLNPDFARVFDTFRSHGYKAATADSDQREVRAEHVERWVKSRRRDFGGANYLFLSQ